MSADESRKQRKERRIKALRASPEDDPLWGLFGVWGRVLIVFANIGFVLSLGATLVGWTMFRFVIHVFGTGLLLLFARPNYSPFLSSIYCDSGMTREEINELRNMVLRKLTGRSPGTTTQQTVEVNVVQGIASELPRQQLHPTLAGSLGTFGRFLRRFIDAR